MAPAPVGVRALGLLGGPEAPDTDLGPGLPRLLAGISPFANPGADPALAEVAAALGEGPSGGPIPVGDAFAAIRRLPFASTRVTDSAPSWSAGLRPERRIGPISDGLGRPVWVDLFRRVRQLRFVRSPGGAPFLSLPVVQAVAVLATSTLRAGQRVEIAQGSLWFATGLVSSAPPGTWTGIRIARGTLRLSADATVAGTEVVVPEAVALDLSIELEPPEPASPRPDTEFAATVAGFPAEMDLSLRPGANALTLRGGARLAAWGADIALTPRADAPVHRPDLNRLVLPMDAEAPDLAIAAVRSAHFVPSGRAPIRLAGLALPAASLAVENLGEAEGIGALRLELDPGLAARWDGEARPVTLGPALLLLDAGRLALTGQAAAASGAETRLSLATEPGGHLTSARLDGAPVHYFTGPDGAESVVTQADVEARPSAPVTVSGDRVAIRLPRASLARILSVDGTRRLTLGGTADPDPTGRRLAFALTNAVLRASPPFAMLLSGRIDGDELAEGSFLVGHRLQGMLPSLPDPYAANLGLDRRFGASDRGILVSDLRWGPAGTTLTFRLPDDVVFDGVGAASDAAGFSAVPTSVVANDGPLGDLLEFEAGPRIVLLDLSGAASRLGVALRPPSRQDSVGGGEPLRPPGVADLGLAVDGRLMVLLTLPAVQWEPVRAAAPSPPFPEEVRFANSGLPTVIDVPSVELVPMTPLAAYREVLETPEDAAPRARFTLPFGMVAGAWLSAPRVGRGARISEARPATADGLEGAHQLRLRAEDPTLGPDETPALPGATLQLANAQPVAGGAPVSILGAQVTPIFNSSLGPNRPQALVPVTRIDIAGHGASMFSAWANPDDPETGVAKAEFQVLNGRAAYEVVQVKTILAPYFVPVVRTITLERQGSAVVTRHDSGWQPVRDGTYRPTAGSGVVTHPGAVLRATRVSNIRDTGEVLSGVAGLDWGAVRFDTDLVIDGAPAPVPTQGQEGWVKLTDTPLTAAAYAALIARVGPMGGPIDATTAIAGGPVRMRLHRVGVGIAGPEFAMAAWGSPIFPGGGDWSVLEVADSAGAPAPVAADRGLPLIRQGAAGTPTSAPWRFADPEDLFDAAAPRRDYGLLHAMGTQRAFFRRPRIEPAQPGRIVSTERPVLADPLVLATATGPFPRQSDAIPFPSAVFALEARPDGTWRLDGPGTFPAGVGRRTIRAAGTVRSDLDYAAATVTYELDTALPVPWRFRLERARKVMAHTSMGDLVSMEAQIDAEAGRATAFADPKLQLGGPFDIVQDLLTIMQDLGVPARPDVRMTNKWSLSVGLTIPFVKPDGEDYKVIPGEPLPTIKFADTGAKIEIAVAPKSDEATFELGGTPMFAIKAVPGLYAVAIIKFKIQLSTESGTTYGVLIGVGIAYALEAGPFELKGLFAITFFAVFGDTVLGYGIGFLVKLQAELPPIVAIEISLEGKFARLVAMPGTGSETVFQIAKLVFAIEVSVFMVFSINLEVETKKIEVIRGPLPVTAAPDVL